MQTLTRRSSINYIAAMLPSFPPRLTLSPEFGGAIIIWGCPVDIHVEVFGVQIVQIEIGVLGQQLIQS